MPPHIETTKPTAATIAKPGDPKYDAHTPRPWEGSSPTVEKSQPWVEPGKKGLPGASGPSGFSHREKGRPEMDETGGFGAD